jgi:hypothetical protein
MHAPTHHPVHHLRFYIVMITLVAGGIFLILLLNNDNNGSGITSAIIGNFQNGSGEEIFEDSYSADNEFKERVINKKRVPITLSFDKTINYQQDIKISEMNLNFNDLTTTIMVNEDKLELNNLQEVSLKVEGFKGAIIFEKEGFSLDGKVRRLTVNEMALSSNNEISITFNNLDYHYINIKDLELENLEFPKGNGNMKIGDKLDYSIINEELFVSYFEGDFTVDKNNEPTLMMDGMAQGIRASGDALLLTLE